MRRLLGVLVLLAPHAAWAHDFAPGRLDVTVDGDAVEAQLAVPLSAPGAEDVRLVPPDGCRVVASHRVPHERMVVTRSRLTCDGDIPALEVAGLMRSRLDLFVQLDGTPQPLLRPAAPVLAIDRGSVADTFRTAFVTRFVEVLRPVSILAALAVGLFCAARERRFVALLLPVGFLAGLWIAVPAFVTGGVLLLGAVALAARRTNAPIPHAALVMFALAAGLLVSTEAPRLDVALVQLAGWWIAWVGLAFLGATLTRWRRPLAPVLGVAAAFCLGL
ncbi:MAG: hypothetical protein RMA76_40715 [Deltaproteobacteria bacterium]|jgi:hypothetical protein